MTIVDVLDAVAGEGIELAWREGRLMARPAPSPELARLIGRYRLRIAAHLTGSSCLVCGQACHPDHHPHPRCGDPPGRPPNGGAVTDETVVANMGP